MSSSSCRRFSFGEIVRATDNFSDSLGEGSFGVVYRGCISENDEKVVNVAVKRLREKTQQNFKDFKKEIDLLREIRHRHVVSLLGWCEDGSEMILICELMSRGSLYRCLYEDKTYVLTVKQRLEICIGAAKGLDYLHSGASLNVIHSDVKSDNILLDNNWVSKIADFGLSRARSLDQPSSQQFTLTYRGTTGYTAPECYNMVKKPSRKADVYALGVVILEVLCEKKAWEDLTALALPVLKTGQFLQITAPCVANNISPGCLDACACLIRSCLKRDPTKRPNMSKVVSDLELALQLQEGSTPSNSAVEDFKRYVQLHNIMENPPTGVAQESESISQHQDTIDTDSLMPPAGQLQITTPSVPAMGVFDSGTRPCKTDATSVFDSITHPTGVSDSGTCLTVVSDSGTCPSGTDATGVSASGTRPSGTDATGVSASGTRPSRTDATGVFGSRTRPSRTDATGVSGSGTRPSRTDATGVSDSGTRPSGTDATGVSASGTRPSTTDATGVSGSGTRPSTIDAAGVSDSGTRPSRTDATGVSGSGTRPSTADALRARMREKDVNQAGLDTMDSTEDNTPTGVSGSGTRPSTTDATGASDSGTRPSTIDATGVSGSGTHPSTADALRALMRKNAGFHTTGFTEDNTPLPPPPPQPREKKGLCSVM